MTINIDALEKLAKDAAQSGTAGHRIKFFMTVAPEPVLALIAEVRALREDKLMLGFELLGVITDVEQGNGFDNTCLETIKRVCKKLGDAARGSA